MAVVSKQISKRVYWQRSKHTKSKSTAKRNERSVDWPLTTSLKTLYWHKSHGQIWLCSYCLETDFMPVQLKRRDRPQFLRRWTKYQNPVIYDRLPDYTNAHGRLIYSVFTKGRIGSGTGPRFYGRDCTGYSKRAGAVMRSTWYVQV